MSHYYEWDNFKDIYLEDSFVISINDTEKDLSFVVEIVLTEKNIFYKPPHEDEQYCYKKGEIRFCKIQAI